MIQKPTEELMQVLQSAKPRDLSAYMKDYQENLVDESRPFMTYFKQLVAEKKLRLQDIFLTADIPERYGYKLISEEKRTRQRDVILRLCYAAHFSVQETQRALKIYGMAELYPKVPRDAVLIVAFNTRPGDIIDVNRLLQENHMEKLRTSGDNN